MKQIIAYSSKSFVYDDLTELVTDNDIQDPDNNPTTNNKKLDNIIINNIKNFAVDILSIGKSNVPNRETNTLMTDNSKLSNNDCKRYNIMRVYFYLL